MTSTKMTRVRPFDRQDGENGTSWDGFIAYRSMSPGSRSIAAVATSTGVPISTLKSNASAWSWVARAAEYDRWLDSQRTESAADEERVRGRRQREILNELGTATLLEVRKLLADIQSTDSTILRSKDILKAAELVIKLSRLVDGQSTENVAVAGVSYANLSDEELAQLEVLATKVSSP